MYIYILLITAGLEIYSPPETIPELILGAVAAAKGRRTITEIASTSKCEGHLSQLTQWKRQLLEAVREVFSPIGS